MAAPVVEANSKGDGGEARRGAVEGMVATNVGVTGTVEATAAVARRGASMEAEEAKAAAVETAEAQAAEAQAAEAQAAEAQAAGVEVAGVEAAGVGVAGLLMPLQLQLPLLCPCLLPSKPSHQDASAVIVPTRLRDLLSDCQMPSSVHQKMLT